MFYTSINLIAQILCYVAAFGLSDYYVKNYKKLKGKQQVQFYSIMGVVGFMLYHL